MDANGHSVRGGAAFAFGASWPHSGMQSRRSAAEGAGLDVQGTGSNESAAPARNQAPGSHS
jgi:hypothetical protein